MKLECSVEKIKNAVFLAERITGKNLTLPVLSTILFEARGKTLKLRATNLSLGVEIALPAKIDQEGTLAVSGGVLSDVFANIAATDNVILEGEGGNITIKTKRNKIKVKGEPHDDFPTLPVVAGQEFGIDPKKLIEGIKSVYFSSAVSDVKPEISSVYLYSNMEGVVFVATDSFRLAEKKIKTKGVEDLSLLIPFKNIPEILRALGEGEDEVKICFNKNQISFAWGSVYLTSRVIDGVFPDYRQIIPKEATTEALVLKQDLLGALKLSNIFSDKFNQVNLKIAPKEKSLEFSAANNDVGESKSEMDASLKGEAVELSFNFRYFLDCLPSIASDSLSIKLNGSTRPIVVSPVSDPSFTYLIMPMNR